MMKIILTTLLLVMPLLVNAYDVEVDGIYYNLKPGNVAEVTFGVYENYEKFYYSGEVIIPEMFTYEGVDYYVTSIGSDAFAGCEDLISITIPKSVTRIGSGAFEGSSGLTSVNISDLSAWCNIDFSDNPLIYAHQIFLKGEKIKDLVIPNTVTKIGNWAFWGCSSLASVTIPNSVTSIGEGAFSDCSGLTSVIIPNSVTTIGCYAFFECSNLISVSIPNSVTSIENYTFYGCSNLISVTIPNSVKKIGCAFSGCIGLQKVIVNDISAWCAIDFVKWENPLYYSHHLYSDENTEITELVIPNTTTSISDYAFMGCYGLTSVTIPSSVTSIGERVFVRCDNLVNVYCLAVKVPYAPNSEYSPFASYSNDIDYTVSPQLVLYVPAASINDYKNTAPWSGFNKILPIENRDYNLNYVVDGEIFKVYTLKPGDIITPESVPVKEGFTFSGWSEIPETMPANDVTITGSFTINKYKLTYMIDGVEYKSSDLEFGTTITPEVFPTKEGYTFSGWSEIPETMPANDVTITGIFTPLKYKLTYMIDGEEYKSAEFDYGTAIIPETVPIKEGYTFSGWSEIPSTMPANNVIITGTFVVNKYIITYMVDDEILTTEEVAYGSTIAPPKSQKEGYDISWNSHPTIMPAFDITIYGSYTTGLDALNGSQSQDDAPVYNLNGQRVEKATRGVYIRNGKKVLVK